MSCLEKLNSLRREKSLDPILSQMAEGNCGVIMVILSVVIMIGIKFLTPFLKDLLGAIAADLTYDQILIAVPRLSTFRGGFAQHIVSGGVMFIILFPANTELH